MVIISLFARWMRLKGEVMRNDEITRTGLRDLIEEIKSIKDSTNDGVTREKLGSLNSRLCRELDNLSFNDNLDYSTVKFACHWAVTLLPGYLETLKRDIENCEDEDIKKMLVQAFKENSDQYEKILALNDEVNG